MPVPNTFANVTTSIPLSNLDNNFATPITIGNTAVQLGNTVTTLNNMTLANVTISSGNTTVTSETISGNLTFTGTGNRITGDFSNATVANRVMFQTSTTNSSSVVGVLPNGTGTITQFAAYGGSDPANAQVTRFDTRGGTESRIESTYAGTPTSGTYLPMTFYTGGSERMRIDTSGNVGIGTSSPVRQLSVGTPNGGVGTAINIGSGTSSLGTLEFGDGATGDDRFRGYVQYSHSDNSLRFGTDAVERARIDSSGNVGIGTSSPLSTAMLEVSRSTTVIPTATVTADNQVVGWRARRTGGTYPYEYYMGIRENSTALDFYDNTANALRARIDSSGNLLVGTTNTSATAGVGMKFIFSADVNNPVVKTVVQDSSGAYSCYNLYSTNAGAYRFYVTTAGVINATSTTITGISDQRLKENIRDLNYGLSELLLVKPRRFDWKDGKGQDKKDAAGFIAQEFEQVFPNSVSTSLAGEDGIEYKTLCHEELIPTMVKAIQEQQQMIETLQAKVAALEGVKK